MGLFDNLAGMMGGGGAGAEEGQQGGGLMGLLGGFMNHEAGPSSGVVGSLLGGGQGQAGAAQDGDAQDNSSTPAAAGGMAAMLEQLAANGLGGHVSSWLSNNPNLPISAQQIHDALGSQQVQQMASSSGLPVGDFLNQLAAHLPAAASEQAGVAQS